MAVVYTGSILTTTYYAACRVVNILVLMGLIINLFETTRSLPGLWLPCAWLVSFINQRFILSDFPTKILYACLINTRHSACLTHCVLDVVYLKMFSEEKELGSWSLYSFFPSAYNFLRFVSKHLFSTVFSHNFNLAPPS
jgi:hypothetical protein